MTPATALYLVPRYDPANPRADYLAKEGTAAPAFDAKRRPQLWRDKTLLGFGPHDAVEYKRLPRHDEPPVLQKFVLVASEAGSVNLPGISTYPDWSPAPTVAKLALPDQVSQTINLPEYLSTLEQASTMEKEIVGNGLRVSPTLAVEYNSETRRVYEVSLGGAWLNVGLLLYDKYQGGLTGTADTAGFNVAHGVGAPGSWDFSNAQPKWKPALIDLGAISNNLPELDPPCRELNPGEFLVWGVSGLELHTSATDAATQPGQLPSNYAARFDAHEALLIDVSHRLTKLGV